ncbi:hypothetical protein KIS4809_4604 [Bacillus sp. ZZV12-4809]|nr:hypothetical protein KIS4809_4604 [Bacillus sp. ZZV12-4809]
MVIYRLKVSLFHTILFFLGKIRKRREAVILQNVKINIRGKHLKDTSIRNSKIEI